MSDPLTKPAPLNRNCAICSDNKPPTCDGRCEIVAWENGVGIYSADVDPVEHVAQLFVNYTTTANWRDLMPSVRMKFFRKYLRKFLEDAHD